MRKPVGWFGKRRMILAASLAGAGCADRVADAGSGLQREELTSILHDSAGVRVLTLSHTLRAVASGWVRAVSIVPDLRVGNKDGAWFGAAIDVASLGRGRFAVFDRMEKSVFVFDSQDREGSKAPRM